MDNYSKVISKNNGIIYASKLDSYNMTRNTLRELVKSGVLVRIMHGVYAASDKDINEFWYMGEKYKKGIYSHNTALYFYNLTDRTPLKLDMTFPSNIRLKNDILNIHYIKENLYQIGLTKMTLKDGSKIQVYNIERTICDIIRDRNKIDPQIFNIALNEYMKLKNKRLNLLYSYAEIFKIDKILIQYMEVLN